MAQGDLLLLRTKVRLMLKHQATISGPAPPILVLVEVASAAQEGTTTAVQGLRAMLHE
jgi:hypothetical protein